MASIYRPSKRQRKHRPSEKLDLVPVMDSCFILIFFLLTVLTFNSIFEISSDIPIVSTMPPPPEKEIPLALTLDVTEQGINVLIGIPARMIKTVPKLSSDNEDFSYDLKELHSFLVELKKEHQTEKKAILEVSANLTYESLVKIMDHVRMYFPDDEVSMITDDKGQQVPAVYLFDQIIFSNIMT